MNLIYDMILSFKHQFVDKIINGKKIHTIRKDKHDRWHKGRKIHFATGIRTPNYNQFYSGTCVSTQKIYINPDIKDVIVETKMTPEQNIDPEKIALKDGFDNENDFWDWFDEPFEGKLIHWTNFNY
jgi:hypothetical protein